MISTLQIIMHFSIPPLSYILTVPICLHKYIHFLLPPVSHTHKHTNFITLSLTPHTYLPSPHYTFPIPPMSTSSYYYLKCPIHIFTCIVIPVYHYQCVLSHYSLSLPTLPHNHTHICTILIFHSMTHTVSMPPLSHTFWSYTVTIIYIALLHFHNDFIPFYAITHIVRIVTIIIHTLHTSPLLSILSILSPSLYQTHGPDNLRFHTWCPSLDISSFCLSFVPFFLLFSPTSTLIPTLSQYMDIT